MGCGVREWPEGARLERFLMTNRVGFARSLMTLDNGLERVWPTLGEKLAWYAVVTCHNLT